MQSDEDREASKARAKRLHAEIEQLKQKPEGAAPPRQQVPKEVSPESSPAATPGGTPTRELPEETSPSPAAPNYRDFVEQRMRELKQEMSTDVEEKSKDGEKPAPSSD